MVEATMASMKTIRVGFVKRTTGKYFTKIVADRQTVRFGTPLPHDIAKTHADPAEVEAIRKWIAGGAKPPPRPAI